MLRSIPRPDGLKRAVLSRVWLRLGIVLVSQNVNLSGGTKC